MSLYLENGTISILNAVGIGDTYQPQCGHAYPKYPSSNKGIWSVYFPDELSSYFILSNGTDYDYYSAVYYCKDSDVGPIEEDGLILTRYKHPSFSQVTIFVWFMNENIPVLLVSINIIAMLDIN